MNDVKRTRRIQPKRKQKEIANVTPEYVRDTVREMLENSPEIIALRENARSMKASYEAIHTIGVVLGDIKNSIELAESSLDYGSTKSVLKDFILNLTAGMTNIEILREQLLQVETTRRQDDAGYLYLEGISVTSINTGRHGLDPGSILSAPLEDDLEGDDIIENLSEEDDDCPF